MKKSLPLIFLLLAITFTHAIAQSSRLVGQVYYINFYPSDSASFTYTGDNGGDLTHLLKYTNETIYGYNANVGVDSFYRYELIQETFNGSNYKTDSLTQFWDSTKWANEWRTLFNYDANNHDTLAYYQTWNSALWVGNIKTYYHYTNNRVDTATVVDTLYNGGWANSFKSSYAYNAAGYVTDEVWQYWNTNNNSWLNTANEQQLFYYDAFNNDTTAYIQGYDTLTRKWVNLYSYINTFDAHHNLLTQTDLYYDTTAVDTVGKLILGYKYDANGNDTADFAANYNYTTHLWDTIRRNTYIYNSFNQVTYNTSYNVESFEPFNEGRYYYEDYTSAINQLPATTNPLSIYPNPSTGLVTISSNQLPINNITVTNLLGQTVLKSPSGDLGVTRQLDLTSYPSGMYFITVTTGSETETQKIILDR